MLIIEHFVISRTRGCYLESLERVLSSSGLRPHLVSLGLLQVGMADCLLIFLWFIYSLLLISSCLLALIWTTNRVWNMVLLILYLVWGNSFYFFLVHEVTLTNFSMSSHLARHFSRTADTYSAILDPGRKCHQLQIIFNNLFEIPTVD